MTTILHLYYRPFRLVSSLQQQILYLLGLNCHCLKKDTILMDSQCEECLPEGFLGRTTLDTAHTL